jgi:prephenate dehydrogenase
MGFERLSVIGVGLLGGSIGLAAKSRSKPCRIKGYGHRRQTLSKALESGAIDEAYDDPVQAVRESELVILCTPVGIFGQILATIGPALRPGTVVTDVGSTKRGVVQAAGQTLPPGVHFVGSHPMAGSEKRGVGAARADLFRAALCITTPTETTDAEALSRVESFWQELGMRVTRLSPDDHDRLLADVSHLPHAVAAALVAMQSDQALRVAGKGFLDATRIAAGDAGLWRDICLDNADSLRDSLHRFRRHLERFEELLDPSRADELRQWLDSAARKRRTKSESSEGSE